MPDSNGTITPYLEAGKAAEKYEKKKKKKKLRDINDFHPVSTRYVYTPIKMLLNLATRKLYIVYASYASILFLSL